MAMVSRKLFLREIEKDIIYKITPAQRTMVVSVYITYKTNYQILLKLFSGSLSAYIETVLT